VDRSFLGDDVKKICLLALLVLLAAHLCGAASRLMDISSFTGMRTNELIGYGIVVGLNGSGDTGKDFATVQSVVNMLQKLGVRIPMDQIETKNCAAVILTSTLPPTCEMGEKIDVHVASVGNARSLYGGTLLMSPLLAGNSEVCAMAQGQVAVGGHNFEVNNNSVSKNAPTSGFIAGGASVERKVEADFTGNTEIGVFTDRNDFVLAEAIIKSINSKFGQGTAATSDGKNIRIKIPDSYASKKSTFLAEVSALEIDDVGEPTAVLDERTGTIIMGSTIPVEEVAISHGNLSVAIASKNVISQPNPFAPGTTIQAINSSMTVGQDKANFTSVKKGATLADVVSNLNKMGVSADDIISIVTDMKVAGAIKGKIIVK
jgi:flagellar P-ring protein precursor FlgI